MDQHTNNKPKQPEGPPKDFLIREQWFPTDIWFVDHPTPEKTNARYKYLLKNGQTGLSVAYDMPTLMGYDPDHELSSGEVGVCGVNVASLKDMEILFDGINLENISVSQTINGPAIILFAFYVALAKKNGIDFS